MEHYPVLFSTIQVIGAKIKWAGGVSEQGGIEGAQIDANQARDMTTPFFEVCLCVGAVCVGCFWWISDKEN